MTTRKAILLSYAENLHEELRINRDLELVKTFLRAAPGGSFEDTEIIELKTNEIDESDILNEIDQVDYSFVYFTGHAHFIDRATWLPSKNDVPIRVSDLQRKNKKQWFFFDCCRVNSERRQSPEFSFKRSSIYFPVGNEKARQMWIRDLVTLPKDVCITYYTTEMSKHSFVNEDGGYGTQLFFTTLSKLLQTKQEIHLKELVSVLNEKKDTLQKGVLWTDIGENIIFRN